MNQLSNVILICEKKEITKAFETKLTLFRKSDKMAVSTLENATSDLYNNNADVCVVYVDEENIDKVLTLMSDIKRNKAISNIPVIALFKVFNEEILVKLFDANLYDYVMLDVPDTVIVMKLIWAFRRYALVNLNRRITNILGSFNIYQDGACTAGYLPRIFEIEINNLIKRKINGHLLIISTDINSRNKISPDKYKDIICKNVRSYDLIGIKNENRIYVLLTRTDIKAVEYFIEKIKDQLPNDVSISVGVSEINSDGFETVEKNALKALTKALNETGSVIISDGYNLENYSLYDNIQETSKNFKLFRQNFVKKLSQVITPVFYQTQVVMQDKLFETKINQIVSEDYSLFSLCKEEFYSELKITHPGFTKICIEKNHSQSGVILKKERQNLEIDNIDENSINEALAKFINEFQKYLERHKI